MNLQIWGASTLESFTDSIRAGCLQAGFGMDDQRPPDVALIQIHGAPAALQEDLRILEASQNVKIPKYFLIHRPDEILLSAKMKSYFEGDTSAKLIFLGDLTFRSQFWAARRARSSVIPHPFLDLAMPDLAAKPIVGSFTSWGEMRDVRHYFELVECLKESDAFQFRIGGPGLGEVHLPSHIQLAREPFVPHFNVQLYHLHGKKRYGESSGSLHRGISIPVIFEANGAERLEGLTVVKVEADDELQSIDFKRAAEQIREMAAGSIESLLESNLKAARRNSVTDFAQSFRKVVEQRRDF